MYVHCTYIHVYEYEHYKGDKEFQQKHPINWLLAVFLVVPLPVRFRLLLRLYIYPYLLYISCVFRFRKLCTYEFKTKSTSLGNIFCSLLLWLVLGSFYLKGNEENILLNEKKEKKKIFVWDLNKYYFCISVLILSIRRGIDIRCYIKERIRRRWINQRAETKSSNTISISYSYFYFYSYDFQLRLTGNFFFLFFSSRMFCISILISISHTFAYIHFYIYMNVFTVNSIKIASFTNQLLLSDIYKWMV